MLDKVTNYAKQHWQVILAALVGVLVLYYLYQTFSGASASSSSGGSSTTPDLSSANQLQALQTSANLTDAQVNAQVETAQIAGQVANVQTAAQLQASEVNTAAQLSATEQQTEASKAVSLAQVNETQNVDLASIGAQAQVQTNQYNDAVEIQNLLSQQAVAQTAIEGSTYEALGQDQAQTAIGVQQAKNQVALSELSAVNEQVNLTTGERDQKAYLTALAPIIQAETGQGGSGVVAEQQSTAAVQVAQAQNNPANTAINAVSNVAGGLFGL